MAIECSCGELKSNIGGENRGCTQHLGCLSGRDERCRLQMQLTGDGADAPAPSQAENQNESAQFRGNGRYHRLLLERH